MHGSNTGRKRILIIEDEPDFAAILKYRLQQKGHEAVIAADGVTGLEEALRSQPDLIVLDLMLPGMGGLEVCRCIRNNPALGYVPIWILTALDSVGHRAKGFMMGADGYFSKTGQLADLLKQTDTLFDPRHAAAQAPPTTAEFAASLAEELLTALSAQSQPGDRPCASLSES